MKAVNIAVGNCRYTGGGWPATPKANPEDGLLDVVVIETLGAGELFELAPAALAEFDYLDKEGIFFARAQRRVRRDPTSRPGVHRRRRGHRRRACRVLRTPPGTQSPRRARLRARASGIE